MTVSNGITPNPETLDTTNPGIIIRMGNANIPLRVTNVVADNLPSQHNLDEVLHALADGHRFDTAALFLESPNGSGNVMLIEASVFHILDPFKQFRPGGITPEAMDFYRKDNLCPYGDLDLVLHHEVPGHIFALQEMPKILGETFDIPILQDYGQITGVEGNTLVLQRNGGLIPGPDAIAEYIVMNEIKGSRQYENLSLNTMAKALYDNGFYWTKPPVVWVESDNSRPTLLDFAGIRIHAGASLELKQRYIDFLISFFGLPNDPLLKEGLMGKFKEPGETFMQNVR